MSDIGNNGSRMTHIGVMRGRFQLVFGNSGELINSMEDDENNTVHYMHLLGLAAAGLHRTTGWCSQGLPASDKVTGMRIIHLRGGGFAPEDKENQLGGGGACE
jgi:hypothetical protein